MIKRVMAGLIIASFLAFCGYGFAQAAPKTQAQDWKGAAATKAHKDLSSRSWTIYVWPADAKGASARETDILTFANGKVTSRNLSTQGYPESNYGLYVGDDGSITWETMQARELKEVDLVFLRGQLFSDGTIKGSMTMQPQRGAKRVYLYSTQLPGTTGTSATSSKKSR
ncbi:MAG: hypothetical protein WC301_04670 [Candidatus Omnitrophota bacterium]|jgi:hypothetical protein